MTINFAAIAVAAPKDNTQNVIDDKIISQLADILGSNQIEFLKEDRGVQILCTEKRQIPTSLGVDIFYLPFPLKPFKLLICDMESTIVDNEFLDEIADFLGLGNKVADITARAMNGELDFESALLERINLIKGLSLEGTQTILQTRLKYNEGAASLVKAYNDAGIFTALVSGGFTYFTAAVAKQLGFAENKANELIYEDNKLIGVAMPILGKEAKLEFLQNKCAQLGIEASQVIAMGDGANDLPMLHAAGLGVAYVAKPKVKEQIFSQINSGNLASLIEIIGLSEFS